MQLEDADERAVDDDARVRPVALAAQRRVRELFLDDGHLHGCAESVLVALKEAYGLPDPQDASAAMALNGGVAYSGSVCGAITGAGLALGLLAGRRIADHVAAKRASRLLTFELLRAFEDEFGASDCRGLTGADLSTPDGHQAFLDGGAWRVGCMRQLEWTVERVAPLAAAEAWSQALQRLETAERAPRSADPARGDPTRG